MWPTAWSCACSTPTAASSGIPMEDYDAGVWHVFVPGRRAGQAYGFRATGPWDLSRGIRCVETKLLLDPYARAIDRCGAVRSGGPRLRRGRPGRSPARSTRPARCRAASSSIRPSTGRAMPLRVAATRTRSSTSCTSKGFTQLHPAVPGRAARDLRRTRPRRGDRAPRRSRHHRRRAAPGAPVRAGGVPRRPRASPTTGATTPSATSRRTTGTRRRCAPVSPGGQVDEFKGMVKRLHAAGLEVILDVVFNHTAEADHLGPTLCHRGLDNPAYYRLDPTDPRRYVDTTGCGNSLNVGHPITLRLIMDSLRYWIDEMHVDGFRFDLATALARAGRRLRPGLCVLRPRRAGPGRVTGQAHRRAVGRRPGRQLRPRALPAAVERVERSLPRHDARLLARTRRADRRVRHPLHRLGRPVRRLPPSTVGVGQPAHGPRRLHPARPRRPTTRSTTRPTARTTATGPTTTGRGTAVPRARPTTRRSRSCGSAGSGRMLTTLLTSLGAPLLLAGDEMGRTQRGNNNAYSPGQRDRVGRLVAPGRRAARLHHPGDRVAPPATRCCDGVAS